jgi:ribonuclease R
MDEGAILDHIAGLPHGRANFKQLVRELGARGAGRAELETALESLTRRGELIEHRGGHYTVAGASREFAVGRLAMHRDGFGFLVPERPVPGLSGDVYIPPDSAAKAMHGDRILARIGRIGPDGRAEGEIVRVLLRAHPTVVGEFRVRRRGNFVAPHDDRIRQWIEIPDGLEVPPAAARDRIGVAPIQVNGPGDLDGLIVNVELLEYPEDGDNAVGRVIEVLGRPNDFGVDVEIVIRKHHLPHRFPPEAVEQAQSISGVITSWEIEGRQDFRSEDAVTIDGETARDFDDAVWVDLLENGNFALHVHIADVAHYVRPGTPIDAEARLRGTSVYFPDRAVPMLPYELSTGICSLLPHADRLVLSALLEIDRQGEVLSQRFTPGVMRSAERMTYSDVHLLLEGDAGLRDRYKPLTPRFELMRELALILNRRRMKRGSIDFDLPEPIIEFDQWGMMIGVSRSPRHIAHRIIEEFMLTANEAVASHLEAGLASSLYRVHEPPDPKRVLEFEEAAARFGYSLGIGGVGVKKFANVQHTRDGRKLRRDVVVADSSVKVSPRHYQKLVEKLEGRPEERILNYLMLRSLKQARYSAENTGHFALAARAYTHFTSPIRRYPDLVIHRLLAASLSGARTPPWADLRGVAEECSHSERRAADAERELVEWKKAKFMEQRVGEDFDALVISATKYGLFVELRDLFVEGLIPIDMLPGDRYTYRENARKIVGEHSRREFSIGDPVPVVLDRVDPLERKLQFSILEPEPARRRKKREGR